MVLHTRISYIYFWMKLLTNDNWKKKNLRLRKSNHRLNNIYNYATAWIQQRIPIVRMDFWQLWHAQGESAENSTESFCWRSRCRKKIMKIINIINDCIEWIEFQQNEGKRTVKNNTFCEWKYLLECCRPAIGHQTFSLSLSL